MLRFRKEIATVITLLWIVASTPFFSSLILKFHGTHTVTGSLQNGKINLVFHHEVDSSHSNGESSDDHSQDHHAEISKTSPSMPTQFSLAPPSVQVVSLPSVAFPPLGHLLDIPTSRVNQTLLDMPPNTPNLGRTVVFII